MDLKGKVAVVTGAASGIGLATCKALVGYQVRAIGMVDRSAAVNDAMHQLNQIAGREAARPYIGDVTDSKFRHEVFRDLKTQFGVVQLCVPAAGITADRLAVKVDSETGQADIYPPSEFEKVLQINLIASVYWALEMVATMAEDRFRRGLGRWEPQETTQGSIVLIGSVSSMGNKGQIAYATAKAGLQGAQATLAKEAIYHGVRCNIIHPGFTDTPMVQALGKDYLEKNILPQTQLRRLLRPDEVADAICFMLRNSAVSGTLWVDAGWHPNA